MNYKIYLYAICVFLSIFALSGINYEKFIKTNKIIETKILIMILALIMGYLLTNLIVEFLELSAIF